MATAFVFLAVLVVGTGADVTVVTVAHNTTVELTCIDPIGVLFPPAWIMNGSLALTGSGYRASRDEDTGELIGTLIINGNHTYGTVNVYCRLHTGEIMHNTSLTVQGSLPSPENIYMINSSAIQWNAPYYAMNSESNFMHVNPHITQYTVYSIDNYTGNCIDKVNVTESSFRRNTMDDHSCPVYRVTAWNSGGEGDMGVPLPGYLPRIPNNIAAEDLAVHTQTPGALHIHLNVTDPCPMRRPNYFLVTVMSTDGVIITTEQYDHQPGHPVAFRIRLLQDVDACNFIVRISAGNNAGMSSPTEFEVAVDCQTTDHIGNFTADTNTPADVSVAQGSSTQITGVIVGVAGGITCVTLAATVLVVVLFVHFCAKFKQKRKEEKDDTVIHHNQAYETGTRTSISRPAIPVPTEPCPAYGVISAHH